MVFWKNVSSGPDGRPSPAAFNMVEVALALAVIGIGLVSILAFFPIGLTAARDAAADSYVADSADHLLHWQAAQMKTSWPFTAASPEETKAASTSSFPGAYPFGSDTISGSGNNFKITQGNDFSAEYIVWRTKVEGFGSLSIGMDVACAINLEVSWPVVAPYAQRKKAYYYLEVFKPK